MCMFKVKGINTRMCLLLHSRLELSYVYVFLEFVCDYKFHMWVMVK